MRKESKFVGKTLEEAIEKAKNFYKEREFEHSVVSDIGRIFNNKVKISTIPKNNESTNSTEKEVTYGYAYIKSGKLIVVDPKVGTEYARIKFDNRVRIKVNGEESYDLVTIRSNDDIDIEISNLIGKREMNVNLSKDKLEAYLDIKYYDGMQYRLTDCNEKEKNNILNLQIEEDVVLPIKRYMKNEVLKKIREMGISTGILEENIENLL